MKSLNIAEWKSGDGNFWWNQINNIESVTLRVSRAHKKHILFKLKFLHQHKCMHIQHIQTQQVKRM